MVYNVAIVEDSPEEASILRAHFTQYSQEAAHRFMLTFFSSGEEFLEKYQPVYDLVLMDIGLPNANGMETAVRLRSIDPAVLLVFVTNLAQFAVKGYEVDAFDFVVKPVSYSNFFLKMQRVLNKLSTRQDTQVVLSLADRMLRLPVSQIKYIEISGHNMTYHTTQGHFSVYGNLKDAEASIHNTSFVRCNNCYLVNLNYVQAIRGFTAVVDGDELQISRPRRKAFVQAVNDFLGGGV